MFVDLHINYHTNLILQEKLLSILISTGMNIKHLLLYSLKPIAQCSSLDRMIYRIINNNQF